MSNEELNNLLISLRKLTEAFEKANEALQYIVGTIDTAYHRAGCPFGGSVGGMMIWLEYGQKTTVN